MASPMGHTSGQRAASCHTACSPVTCRQSNALAVQQQCRACPQGGTLHSSAMSAAHPAAPSCLPSHRVSQCQPSHQQLSWGVQEELFQERRCSQRWWTGGVTPHLWADGFGTTASKELQDEDDSCSSIYQPGRHPEKPRTGEAQDSAQGSSLDHTCALSTHFPTSSSQVSMQMCTCKGRGDTCHPLDQ